LLNKLFNQRTIMLNKDKVLSIIFGGGDMNKYSTKKIFLIHDIVCVIVIIGMIVYTLYAITQMPQTIPIHLTNGVVDGWGSKWISLLMPGTIVFVYVLSILFIRYLKKHNNSIILVSWVKLGCVILFSIVNILFIQFALSQTSRIIA